MVTPAARNAGKSVEGRMVVVRKEWNPAKGLA
jgi:hypothetical protein